MKTVTTKTAVAALSLAAAIGMAPLPALADGELYIYNWSDYTAPDLIAKFEKETGIKVTLDVYDSNETLLAKMKQGNAAYDIVVPSHNFVPILVQEKLIQPINASTLAGYENIEDRWKSPAWDANNVYSIPWQWGTTSFAVDTSIYKGPLDTSAILFAPPPELQGKIGMFKTPEEVVAMAQIYLGMPLCDEDPQDMKKVLELLEAQKPFVKVYSSEGIHERLAAGEAVAHMAWNGVAMRARDVRPTVGYVYPKEGVLAFMDNLTVPTAAPHPENAIKFIEFMMQPENAAIQSDFARYANGIKGSLPLMAEDLRNAPEITPPATMKAVFQPVCSAEAIKLTDRVWTKLFQ